MLIIRCVAILLFASAVLALGTHPQKIKIKSLLIFKIIGFGQLSIRPQVLLNKGVINIRDVRIVEKDALTGVYKGCMVDCTNNPKFYSFTWNMTDMELTQKVLFDVKDSSFNIRWIMGVTSCQFAGAELFDSYLGDFDANITMTQSINLEKFFPVDSFSVFIGDQVITLLLDKSVSSCLYIHNALLIETIVF